MTIHSTKGNLLTADVEALVNTVNTVGVMGKGLALQFKKAFPDGFRDYARACKNNEVEVGRIHVIRRIAAPRYILNFPTKRHWRQPSKMEYIEAGLRDLVDQVAVLDIKSIAIPPLGCGNGGLPWAAVRPLIEKAFANLPDVRVLVFDPNGAPPANKIIDRRKKPAMTAGRAALIRLMASYLDTGYESRLSLIEAQKLAYFLQEAGQELRLQYSAHIYGPYADGLRKVLRHIEGHYTCGVGDGQNSPETPLELLKGAREAAEGYLQDDPETAKRITRVGKLIEGFETPLGMELLATVHWVMANNDTETADDVIEHVHNWSERKRSMMKDHHIRAGYERLHHLEWL